MNYLCPDYEAQKINSDLGKDSDKGKILENIRKK